MNNIKNLRINEELLLEVIEDKNKDEQIYRRISLSSIPFADDFEAYYFASVRNFFRNSIAHNIMRISQDIPKMEEKVKCKL